MRSWLMVLLMAASVVGSRGASAQQMLYDSVWNNEQSERSKRFRALSPAQQVEVLRTHIDRWSAANREQHTTERSTVLMDLVCWFESSVMGSFERDGVPPDEIARRFNSFQRRGSNLFKKDWQAVSTLWGDYVPTQP
jgi:hypothetical protein